MGRPAWAASAADTAVKAAEQYKGRTITIVWEAGLQSLDPTHFSGPKWKELTGMDVKVIEVATAEMFTNVAIGGHFGPHNIHEPALPCGLSLSCNCAGSSRTRSRSDGGSGRGAGLRHQRPVPSGRGRRPDCGSSCAYLGC